MRKWLCVFLCGVVVFTVQAEKKQLDLRLDPAPFYNVETGESTWYRDSHYQDNEQKLSRQCSEMQRQMKALKGKPQQKFTLQQRYEAECMR